MPVVNYAVPGVDSTVRLLDSYGASHWSAHMANGDFPAPLPLPPEAFPGPSLADRLSMELAQRVYPAEPGLNSLVVVRETLQVLKKLEEGTYGICDYCKEEIPARRLEVYPRAARCVDCQQEHEWLS